MLYIIFKTTTNSKCIFSLLSKERIGKKKSKIESYKEFVPIIAKPKAKAQRQRVVITSTVQLQPT